jgi:hypothetical protein
MPLKEILNLEGEFSHGKKDWEKSAQCVSCQNYLFSNMYCAMKILGNGALIPWALSPIFSISRLLDFRFLSLPTYNRAQRNDFQSVLIT